MEKADKKSQRRTIGCMAAVICTLAALLIYKQYSFGYWPKRSFNSEDWRKVSLFSDETRIQMIDDLLQSGRLDRATREEVLELLGRPTELAYFSDWDLVYLLGPERGFIRLDSEWLVINFDEAGRVEEYLIMRD